MRTELTWRHLKGLNQLYIAGRTAARISDNAYIKNVLMEQKKLIRHKSGNLNILESTNGFKIFYEQNLKTDFTLYESFLQNQELEDDGRRQYTEKDIRTLMFIVEQKEELVKNLTTIKTFSGDIFEEKGGKYLENRPGLKNAVCKILGITDFPDKDPQNLQWRFVIDCIDPGSIVLCENLDRLKNPWKAREHNVELWYVGGNNIGIIDFIDSNKFRRPIFYCCDWDFHGLSIYSRIKEKMKSKSCDLNLLIPDIYEVSLPIDSPHHKSRWNFNKQLSGLKQEDFSDESIKLIERLMLDNRWIEEESLDLFKIIPL